jgi:glycosyltransferase involved in cell wall biosynthesis
VIVCTRDRAEWLRGCLEAIIADASLPGREVLVVDNGSTDGTSAVVRDLQARYRDTSLRLLSEPRSGKSHALNTGIAAATGALLLFTDDDVLVADGWAGALAEALSAEGVAAAGGRTLPLWEGTPPAWVEGRGVGALGLVDLGDIARPARPWEIVGANMALRGADLAALDLRFEAALGPAGSLRVNWEERHLLEQVAQHRALAYTPAALGRHRVPTARLTPGAMRRLAFQSGFGKARHERLMGHPPGSFLGRLVSAAVGYHRAWRVRDRNRALGTPTAMDASAEFLAYDEAGRRLDMLLKDAPALAAWVAGRAV